SDARRVESVGKKVLVRGWVRSRRDSKGGFSFIELNDGSCQGNVQVVAPGELANYESEIKKLPTGASIAVEGEVLASPAKGQPTDDSGAVDYTKDFVHKPAVVTVSGQLQVESFACSMGKVYAFGPTFRAENSNTPRHLAEFWMIEPEMAFYDLQDNMTLAEGLLKYLIQYALDNADADLEFLNNMYDKELITRLKSVIEKTFTRL